MHQLLLIIVIIYCILGFLLGIFAMVEEGWPKRKIVEDRVVGLASYRTIDWPRTIGFFILMGPAFWVVSIMVFIFGKAVNLLN